jgi:hypothetical protein
MLCPDAADGLGYHHRESARPGRRYRDLSRHVRRMAGCLGEGGYGVQSGRPNLRVLIERSAAKAEPETLEPTTLARTFGIAALERGRESRTSRDDQVWGVDPTARATGPKQCLRAVRLEPRDRATLVGALAESMMRANAMPHGSLASRC